MRYIPSFLLAVCLGFGATAYDPDGGGQCASFPCTITITCVAETCTAGEVDEVQTALDYLEANQTDAATLKLEKGRLWTLEASEITVAGTATGGLTITTTGDSQLPPSGVRITPAYRTVMAIMQSNATASQYSFGLEGGTATPAENVTIRGLWFEGNAGVTLANGQLQVGDTPAGLFGGAGVTSPADQPGNIKIQHCVFLTDALNQIGRQIRYYAREGEIVDNWLGPTTWIGNEGQVIGLDHGEGPVVIRNNYIGAATENILFGGTGSITGVPFRDVVVSGNYFEWEPKRQFREDWSASLSVWKGKVIRNTAGTEFFQAQNAGTTGAVEPTWPTLVGQTVVDNGITWENVSSDYTTKNHFEIKSLNGLRFVYNGVRYGWQLDQSGGLVPHLSNCVQGSSVCQQTPELSAVCDVSGTTVTLESGTLPNTWALGDFGGDDASTMVVDGGTYEITDRQLSNPGQLTIDTDLGSLNDVACSYGVSNVIAGFSHNVTFKGLHVRDVAAVFSFASYENSQLPNNVGNFLTEDVLVERLDRNEWYISGPNIAGIQMGQTAPNFRFRNNTIIAISAGFDVVFYFKNNPGTSPNPSGSVPDWPNDIVLREIIFSQPNGGVRPVSSDGGPVAWGSKYLRFLCGEHDGITSCPESQIANHIVAGADVSNSEIPAADIDAAASLRHNLCPTDASCTRNFDYDDPTFGKLFRNFVGEESLVNDYTIRTGHYAFNSGRGAKSWGADPRNIPRISDVVVLPTASSVVMKWRVSPVLSRHSCTVNLQTNEDPLEWGTVVSSLDPNLSANPGVVDPNTDGDNNWLTRGVTIGGLSGGTQYYGWIHCGGAVETFSVSTL